MGYFTIIRPVNCVITFVSVLVGAWIGRNIVIEPQLILAGMIGFVVCGFGNVTNDLYDIEVDRINNPSRPLPRGIVSKNIVRLLAVFLFIISILFSISLGIGPSILVLGVSILLFLYASYLKRTIAANFIISFIAAMSFVLGGIVAKNPACLYPFLFSLFIHMPREIIKDAIDVKGDRSNAIKSLPILLGEERSFNIGALLLCILCILLPLPYIMRVLHLQYIIIVLLIAYPIIIYCILRLMKTPIESEQKKLSTLLKISMAVGLVAMIV